MCAFDDSHVRHFILRKDAPVESSPWGPHFWACKPGLVETQQLLVVQVDMPPHTAHAFHYHPGREEVLWVIEGQGEQWVGRQKMLLGAGDSAFIPTDTVHGIYNDSPQLLRFLAILSPADTGGPLLVDVQNEEPWRSLRSSSSTSARSA
jgi:quercetin dioxygenase-like cupin family protein